MPLYDTTAPAIIPFALRPDTTDGRVWKFTQDDGSTLYVKREGEGFWVKTEPGTPFWGDNESLRRPPLKFFITFAQMFQATHGFGADCGDGINVNCVDRVYSISRSGMRSEGGGESMRIPVKEWRTIFPVTDPKGNIREPE